MVMVWMEIGSFEKPHDHTWAQHTHTHIVYIHCYCWSPLQHTESIPKSMSLRAWCAFISANGIVDDGHFHFVSATTTWNTHVVVVFVFVSVQTPLCVISTHIPPPNSCFDCKLYTSCLFNARLRKITIWLRIYSVDCFSWGKWIRLLFRLNFLFVKSRVWFIAWKHVIFGRIWL